jgi:hypothetical protein
MGTREWATDTSRLLPVLPLNGYAARLLEEMVGRHATLFNVSLVALKSSAARRFHG